MSPLVKDTAGNEPAVSPSRLRTVAVADEAARPQPVCIEVPITIQGVRAAKTGEKREPFTESTRTVIVFANGAVVRLAAPVNAGQPLFLTNERTHKEIVCQVVKSRTYASVPGYVEIEFTEPNVGFWGMRFPSDQVHPESESEAAPSSGARPDEGARAVAPPASPVATPVAVPSVAVSSLPPSPAPSPQVAEIVEKPAPAIPPVKPAAVPETHAPPTPVAPSPAASAGPVSSTPPLVPPPFHVPEPVEKPAPAIQPIRPITVPEAHVAPTAVVPAPVAPQEPAPSMLQPAPPPSRAPELVEKPAPTVPPVRPAAVPDKPVPPPVAVSAESVASTMPPPRLAAHPTVLAETPLPPQPIHPRPPAPTPRVEERKIQPSDSFAAQSGAVPRAPAVPLSGSAPSVSEIPVSAAKPRSGPAAPGQPESQGARQAQAVFSSSLFGKPRTKKEGGKAGSRSAYAGLIAAGVLIVAGGVAWHWWQHSGRLTAERSAAPIPASNASAAAAPGEQNVVTVTANAASGKVAVTLPSTARPTELASTTSKTEKPGKKSTFAELRLSSPVAARRASAAGGPSGPEVAPEMTSSVPSGALGDLNAAQSAQPGAPFQGGQLIRPKQISFVSPQYTPLAQRQHIQGDVTLDILVDAEGRPAAIKVLSGPALLRQAAMEAVRQWKYQPGLLDGVPTPMHITETVRFRLE